MRHPNLSFLALLVLLPSCKSGTPVNGDDPEPRGWYTLTFDTTDVFDLSFLNPSIGWISTVGTYEGGWRGRVAFTRDGGKSWNQSLILYEGFLYNVHFVDNAVGFAGAVGVHRTSDGGYTWTRTANLAPRTIFKMRFADANTGWGVGNRGTIVKTTDAGQSWFYQDSPYPDLIFRGMSTLNASTAFAVGDTNLIATNDGGSTWKAISIPTFSQGITSIRYFDVKFTSQRWGWVVGEYRVIIRTSDGGTTWVLQSPLPDGPFHSDACTSIDASDSLTAIVVTSQGAILRTDDGGTNWVEQRPSDGRWFFRVQMVTEQTAFAVGTRGTILKTTTGGRP